MTRPGIEPRAPGPLANTLTIMPMARLCPHIYIHIYSYMLTYIYIFIHKCIHTHIKTHTHTHTHTYIYIYKHLSWKATPITSLFTNIFPYELNQEFLMPFQIELNIPISRSTINLFEWKFLNSNLPGAYLKMKHIQGKLSASPQNLLLLLRGRGISKIFIQSFFANKGSFLKKYLKTWTEEKIRGT